MNIWPQVLVGTLLIGLTVAGFVRHGQPAGQKPINCMEAIWISFTLAAVLGAGGFWRLS